MRRTRFMSWIFLVLSLAFFRVHDFRAALEAPLVSLLPDYSKVVAPEVFGKPGPLAGLWNLYTMDRYVSAGQLHRMAQEAEQRGDSQFMAFAALHLTVKERGDHIFHLADRAVAMDPKLTWLYVYLPDRFHNDMGKVDVAKQLRERIDKLQAWDADNSVPYLLGAQLIERSVGKEWTAVSQDPSRIRAVLEQHLEWQKEMRKAFTQPRYETYTLQRFDLERKVMRGHQWDNPIVVQMEMSVVPNFTILFDSREYAANVLVNGLGAHAEVGGEVDKAIESYRQAARFGERMRLQGHTYLEQIVGIGIQRTAYERLVPALEKEGQKSEAAAIDYASKQAFSDLNLHVKDPLEQTSNFGWAALAMSLFAALVWVFFLASLVSVAYVNAKRWIRREKKGYVYQLMTVGENYAPLLLFISSLVLALSYAPYAQNYAYYMDQAELSGKLTLWENTFPYFRNLFRPNVPPQDPYPGYFSFALASFLLLGLIALASHWRTTDRLMTVDHPAARASVRQITWRAGIVFGFLMAIFSLLLAHHAPGSNTGVMNSGKAKVPSEQDKARLTLANAQQALDVYRARHDESSAHKLNATAFQLLDMATQFENQLNHSEARKLDEQALAMFREIDDEPMTAWTLTQLGGLLHYSGDLAGARKMFEEALTLDCKADDEDDAKLVLDKFADVLKSSRDGGRTGEIYQWALRMYSKMDQGNRTRTALIFAGDTLASQQDYAEAKNMYDRALALCRVNCDPDEVASVQEGIIGLFDSQARDLDLAWDFAGARKMYERSLALYRQRGDEEGIENAMENIAELSEHENYWRGIKNLRDPFRPVSQ